MLSLGIESWDTDFLGDQEDIFGRLRNSAGPLTGTDAFDTADLDAMKDGAPVIGVDAHIWLAAPETNEGQKLLRCGYSYPDGIDADTGLLDAGLFFICFQKDLRKQFVPVQTEAGPPRHAQRIHPAHRQRPVRLLSRIEWARRLVGQVPVQLTCPLGSDPSLDMGTARLPHRPTSAA